MRRAHLATKRGTPEYDFPALHPNEVREIGVATGELLYRDGSVVGELLLKKWQQPCQVELLACSYRARLIAKCRHHPQLAKIPALFNSPSQKAQPHPGPLPRTS